MNSGTATVVPLRPIVADLARYCRERNWAGVDPYDALNGRLLGRTPVVNSRVGRLVLTQALKRLPLNLRGVLLVPATQNPKAIALFLMGYLNLARAGDQEAAQVSVALTSTLKSLRSKGTPRWCWGYSFPWQTRTKLVPRDAPNIVCTTFAANALLNAYEANGDPESLTAAVSAGDYIVEELYWTRPDGSAGFSYPLPTVKHPVHNANFLGAGLLCRLFKHTGDTRFRDAAMAVTRYSAARQRPDGSWAYGEASTQGWVDSFHTGYNLSALRSIGENAGTSEFEMVVKRGFAFYVQHFFTTAGASKYFHNRTYPIDIHSAAQAIVTLVDLQDLDPQSLALAQRVCDWTIQHMWDRRGFFYYQWRPYLVNRISYMRWSQAWMFSALTTLTAKTA